MHAVVYIQVHVHTKVTVGANSLARVARIYIHDGDDYARADILAVRDKSFAKGSGTFVYMVLGKACVCVMCVAAGWRAAAS